MSDALSPDSRRLIADLAARHGFSDDAVASLARSLLAGGGRMAQFSHQEFGGMGQWSQGGMLMIGDMFNGHLKGRVGALADDLAQAIQAGGLSMERGGGGASGGGGGSSGGNWWPDGLGSPSSSGSQNRARYAVFPSSRRLAIDDGTSVTVYDTGDHQIHGVSQQQSSGSDLSFQSQIGTVRVSDLRQVDGTAPAQQQQQQQQQAAPEAFVPDELVQSPAAPWQPAPAPDATPTRSAPPHADPSFSTNPTDPIATIERLAGLRDKGILSDAEFAAKKAELLSRL